MLLSLLAVVFLLPGFALSYQRECKKLVERREWRTLSREERAAWISGVKCLTSLRHERLSKTPSGTVLEGLHSIYDDFALTHDMLEDFAHENAYFLPWHRYFTYLFDSALRDRCGYTGSFPYWDWTLDVSDIPSAPVFDSDYSSGLGTNGNCDNTDCDVQDGAFSDVTLAYPVPHRLRRNLTLFDAPTGVNLTKKLDPEYLSNVMETTTGDFFTFQYRFTKAHNNVHFIIRGDMDSECPSSYPKEACDLTSFASNDPLFWLHHGQVDRLWSKWQSMDPKNFYAFQGYPTESQNLDNPLYNTQATVQQTLKFDRLSTSIIVQEVFNHTAPPFCYTYIDIRFWNMQRNFG